MIIKNKSITATNQNQYDQISIKHTQHGKNKQEKSFFAGGLFNNDKQMQMAQKKAMAQKESIRTLVHQHQADLKFAKKKDEILSDQEGLFNRISDSHTKIHDVVHEKNNLDEEYQIDENKKSDAAILEKADRIEKGSKETFTNEEKQRIVKLYDYADKIKGISDNIDFYTRQRSSDEGGIMSDNMALLEYQKYQQSDMGMEKAKKKAEEILAGFSTEAIQMMIKQIKETSDDKEKENDKKSIEKQAKDTAVQPAATKEQQQRNVAEKESKKDAVLTKALVKQDVNKDAMQVEMKALIKKENISFDILKGLEVDQKV